MTKLYPLLYKQDTDTCIYTLRLTSCGFSVPSLAGLLLVPVTAGEFY